MPVLAFESITLNRRAEVTERAPGQAEIFSQTLGALSFTLVKIPPGMFQMGSLRGAGYPDETPQRLVSVSEFYLASFPVTQALWQAVMRRAALCRFRQPELPVENVTWKEAQTFCQRLAKQTGRAYRLPSEAEWEYACRAGSSTPFASGETLSTDYANYVGEHRFAEEPRGVYRHTTTPAGVFPPNAFGLEDMHGNLWEYCADAWHADYTGGPRDRSAWLTGGEAGFRVARGGSWHETPGNCRSAARLRVDENEREDYYGLRLALDAM